MPRTYALALIFAVVTLVSGLFYAQYWYLTGRQGEVTAYAEGVYERVVEGQLAQMQRLNMEVQDRLQDEAKYKYRPILPCLQHLFDRRDSYLDEAKKSNDIDNSYLADFVKLHNAELDSLATSYESFLRAFGGDMDLRLEDINAKVAHIGKAINEARLIHDNPLYSPSEVELTRCMLSLDYLAVLELVVRDVIDISGGKTTCGGEWYFPIMVTDIENPRRGQKVKAKVWVGSYSTSLDPENVVLTVGSDTLKINPDGTADYMFTPKNRGKLEFNLGLSIINPLTGQVTRSEGIRTYNIR